MAAGNPLNDFVSDAEKETTDLSWHGFAGLEFSLPAVPVAIFAEGRIDDIQGGDPRSLAIYAPPEFPGILLELVAVRE